MIGQSRGALIMSLSRALLAWSAWRRHLQPLPKPRPRTRTPWRTHVLWKRQVDMKTQLPSTERT